MMSVPQPKRRQRRPATATAPRPINPLTAPEKAKSRRVSVSSVPLPEARPEAASTPPTTRLCNAALDRLHRFITVADLLHVMAENAERHATVCAALPVEVEPSHRAVLVDLAQNAGAYESQGDAQIARCLLAQSDILAEAAEKLNRLWAGCPRPDPA